MNSLIPMLAVTGRPDQEKIHKMLQSYHENGIHAFMIYPRSGLEVEYMSEEWLDICRIMIDTAKELSMSVWLYDEFNWPSGSCRNTVVKQNEAYRAKCLVYNDGKLMIDTVREEYCGRIFEAFENDVLNPEAVDQFIKLTHERYYERFGEEFGSTILGFFTDEPSFIYTASGKDVFPYYEGLLDDYRALCDRDLFTDFEKYVKGECLGDIPEEQPKDFTKMLPGNYRHLIGEKFRSSYVKRVAVWCKEHGIELTGHFLSDGGVLESVSVTGNLLACLEEMDAPGIDDINTDLSPNILYPQMECMRQKGKKHAMAELFALGPCSMTYAERKRMIWYAAAYGVDRFFIAISHMDAKGNVRKPDFFSDFTGSSPDFKSMAKLAESTERAVEYAGKTPVKYVCIRYPYTECLKDMSRKQEGRCDALLQQLFEAMRTSQIQCLLIGEKDLTDVPVIMAIRDGKIWEERSGRIFRTGKEAVEELINCGDKFFQTRPMVLEADGQLAQDVLVKQYTDDSILVIDTTPAGETAKKRDLVLRNGEIYHAFVLEKYGVYEYTADYTDCEHIEGAAVDISNFSVEQCGKNLLRCMFFESDTYVFEAEKDVEITINTRVYPESGAVFLDGQPACADQGCTVLTDCFNGLYRASRPIMIKAGRHEVKTSLPENPHLPTVVISGDFNREGNKVLAEADITMEKHTFFGQLQVSFTVDIPADAEDAVLCLNDTGLYVEAEFENGKKVPCSFAPYRFNIPKELFGGSIKASLKFYSSLAPIFGDLAEEEKKHDIRADWVKSAPLSNPEAVSLKTLGMKAWRI